MDEELLMDGEVINPTNYPALYQYQGQLQDITNYMTGIANAIDNYIGGKADSINADPGAVAAYALTIRNLCATLSAQSPTPYTVIYGLRDMQDQLQTLLFAVNSVNGGVSQWQSTIQS